MEFDAPTRLTGLPRFEFAPAAAYARRCALAHDFRFGIEEEYFLADAATLKVAEEPPSSLFDTARERAGCAVGREFLKPQIEVATRPGRDTGELRDELVHLRRTVGATAKEHGVAIMACGTHPTARWRSVEQTPKKRYGAVMDGLQMIGQRNMLCGMHVHVEVPDPDRRVDVMSRMLPFLPLFLALSTSSPFWESRPTGLKGYRLAAYDELPRTGLPELFRTTEEYEAYVAAMVRSRAIEDSSFVWWMVRPSNKYPTLELRAPDCCTRMEDAVAIAALYRATVRHLYFNDRLHADLDVVSRALCVENKWRAQRYGVQGTFVSADGALAVGQVLDNLIDRLLLDADALGCMNELMHCREIVTRGTSADEQLRVFSESGTDGGSEAAFRAVSSWIASTTIGSEVD
jgi:glutamate---cysteine ligase / carboxylate-amine ligase